MRPVLLALSTFRYSQEAADLAIEEAKEAGLLVVVYVVDVNLARYFIGTDVGFYPDLMKKTEQEILDEHKNRAGARVAFIIEKARAQGITTRTHIAVGRFALECLPVVKMENPRVIVTKRSDRPHWVRRFFGSPVDHLIEHAGCPVLEA